MAKLANQFNVIIVNPDGNNNSWYLNSPVNSKARYEDYIAVDVVNYIGDNFNTIAQRKGRAITGLSMGGFGALHIAINNQHTFGAVGAMSAGVDLRPFSSSFDIEEVFGPYTDYPKRWTQVAIIENLHKLAAGNNQWRTTPDYLPMMIDIGVDDFFLTQNRQLHHALLALNIRHEYIERPGGHNWQ